MPLPNWVIPSREPHTEIKRVTGAYYKYQVSYAYDPDKKRTVKKLGALLGKITETGFVPSPKYQLRQAPRNPAFGIKTYGVYGLFSFLLADEIRSLECTLEEVAGRYDPLVRHDQMGLPVADKTLSLLPRPLLWFGGVECRYSSYRQDDQRRAASGG